MEETKPKPNTVRWPEGAVLASAWEEYRQGVIGNTFTDPRQLAILRDIFYAGATATMMALSAELTYTGIVEEITEYRHSQELRRSRNIPH